MDIGSILLIAAVAVLVGMYLSRPFSDRRIVGAPALLPADGNEAYAEGQQRSQLMAQRDRMFTALQELDFDHSLRKVTDEDYQKQRSSLLQAGAAVLKQLDELGGVAGTETAASEETWLPDAYDEEDELEQIIARRRADRHEKAAGFCPKCGKPHGKSDSFCSFCGASL